MIHPAIQHVPIPEAEREAARLRVINRWERPDGEELVDLRAVLACANTIRQGYYLRLVFPPGTTREQVGAWHLHAMEVLTWRRLGVV